ncbi:MAG: hypothetical protein JW894_13845 [Bacteroidales bacterium]|nr:hypothetical protein [Bacteroidales bacterium]
MPVKQSEDITRKHLVLSKITLAISSDESFEHTLQQVCDIIPEAYSLPDEVSVRLSVQNRVFKSKKFVESQWLERRQICIPGKDECNIEIYFSENLIEQEGSSILIQDDEFFSNVVTLLMGYIARFVLEKLYYDNTERLKELEGINRTATILQGGGDLEESLQKICSFLPEAWQYPQYTAAQIIYNGKVFKSRKFKPTQWVMRQNFETTDMEQGTIEIYYLKEFPPLYEGPFLKEERNLIDNLAALFSGTASKNALRRLLAQNTERLKELRGINQTSNILKQGRSIEESLQVICTFLPEAWQFPEFTTARITLEDKVFTSPDFKEGKWKQRQEFEAPENKKGAIEIFYLKKFPDADEGPFLKEERDLLINLANLIAGSATRYVFNKLLQENKERLKELRAINLTSKIIASGKTVEDTLQQICSVLPKSWQYPKYTAVRILFDQKIYVSRSFKDTVWVQRENFITIDNKKGTVEVFYLREFPRIYEGPFLKEERNLLINICKLISGYLNDYKGRDIFRKNIARISEKNKPVEYRESLVKNKDQLQLFFNKQILEKYIYLDMMKFKVKEILFVATMYDAFTLQSEENLFEQFMGEIYQYSLFSLPRITGVTSADEAIDLLETTHFDIAILMVGIDKNTPVQLSKRIKQKQPNLLVYLLLNQKGYIQYFEELTNTTKSIDRLFIWSGNSQIFFSIVKSLEDEVNVENDTKIGLVRVILLVEDSAQYYSKYLQILYSIVFGQVQQLLPEVEKRELDKIVKMRSRPKILLARNYEDAIYIFNKYKDFMLCVISDVEFEKEGKIDKKAGIKFIRYVQSHIFNLPIVLQSSDDKNHQLARELKVSYINKNSETLLNDLKNFLLKYLGFGDFIFRDKEGKKIGVARSLREFETQLQQITNESFYLHALENQFSLWLMARGEINLARTLNPLRIGDFSNVEESREFLINQLRRYKEEKKRGKILNFEETSTLDEYNIVLYSGGSLGGKGRGLAFINTLINNLDFSVFTDRINIRAPKTIIIGTDEFESFIENNNIFEKVIKVGLGYENIRKRFVEAELSAELKERLKVFLGLVDKPIAVRSSSLLEDSVSQPFAGIFDTYIIPYDGNNVEETFEKLIRAIKLVFASVYSDDARAYFSAIHHKIEEERMAVVLQELVGETYGQYCYPHISGVAQSFNYYPLANMDPEEGFAVIAVGLGAYVVGGRNAYRFSPKYPKIDMFTIRDMLSTSQLQFYALDLSKQDVDFVNEGELASLSLLDISHAEEHGTLKHCVSVYNAGNDSIEPGLSSNGPRIVNFAEILKYNYIPLAETIDIMLKTLKDAVGSPIEIEFAVDLNPTKNNLPSFYLLQVKPLVGRQQNLNFNLDNYDKSKIILYTRSSLGNGEINHIRDIIFADPAKFDKLETMEMVSEMEYMNSTMRKKNKQYILIGPGRWGTRDRFLGIPVNWHHISNAKVIVEMSLVNFPLDSSLGSHFFHNVTSMNIGYFSVQNSSLDDFIKWDVLNKQTVINSTKHFKHICFQKPLTVLMNGREKTSAIIDNT